MQRTVFHNVLAVSAVTDVSCKEFNIEKEKR